MLNKLRSKVRNFLYGGLFGPISQTVEVYERSSIEITSLEDAVSISMTLALMPPLNLGGFKHPQGRTIIAASQYNNLPERLKKYFVKTTITLQNF